MGTRNLTCVVLDGVYRVAQYGQWDGYPGGQGATALEFLRGLTADGMRVFKEKLRALSELTAEEYKALWVECGADPNKDMVSYEIHQEFGRRFPYLHRDCGAEILDHVLQGRATKVQIQTDFAKDSLFCEWAYVIDLDAGTFEVFTGFSKEPNRPGARFVADAPDRSGYYAVRLVKAYKLANLPTVADMVARCDGRAHHRYEVGSRTYRTLYGARMACRNQGLPTTQISAQS